MVDLAKYGLYEKTCQKCKNVFWAKRKDTKKCGCHKPDPEKLRKLCTRCGRKFLAFRSDAKTCGCRRPSYEELRKICEVCNVKYFARSRISTTCSRKCSKKLDYHRHKETYNARTRLWRQRNIEHVSSKRKERYWKDPEKWKKESKEWARNNKAYKSLRDRKYKDKIRHGGKRQKLIDKHGYVCSQCDKKGSTFNIIAHHKSFDKTDHTDQELLCRSCHAKIHSKHRRSNV